MEYMYFIYLNIEYIFIKSSRFATPWGSVPGCLTKTKNQGWSYTGIQVIQPQSWWKIPKFHGHLMVINH